MMRAKTELRRGTDRRALWEKAWIDAVNDDDLLVSLENLSVGTAQVFLHGNLRGRIYFFSCEILEDLKKRRLRLALPRVVYLGERRERKRDGPRQAVQSRVALELEGGAEVEANIEDTSEDGLGISLAETPGLTEGAAIRLRFLDGGRVGQTAYGQVTNVHSSTRRSDWTRIGLALLPSSRRSPVAIERLDSLRAAVAHHKQRISDAAPDLALRKAQIVEYRNQEGEVLRALVDWCGNPRGAPVAIIPPAWGKTKETLLPLAATLIETFQQVGESLVVLRFDGIRRRGESHNDADCAEPGRENLHYTFSQGYRDILATLDFLESSREFRSTNALLVTFSVAAIEARRAIVLDAGRRIRAWISGVGSPDPQSLLRVSSGGIDYFSGAERGILFGPQEVQGLTIDMDRATRDAIAEEMAFLADARRDMAKIGIPITWFFGHYDAWTELSRVADVLSFGETRQRRIVDLPVGHQLRDSAEAMAVFGLIAEEAARLMLRKEIHSVLPDKRELRRLRMREAARIARKREFEPRKFWRDYLVGRDGVGGIELLMNTSMYEEFMGTQVRELRIEKGDRIGDLGCGVGALAWFLQTHSGGCKDVRILGIDIVQEALNRARRRWNALGGAFEDAPEFVVGDLGRPLPIKTGGLDAVCASLVLNYVANPKELLGEIFRVLRPGGRLVASCVRRDADISRICVNTVAELRSGRARDALGPEGEGRLARALKGFINDAGKLLDLEERGVFQFWDQEEFLELARSVGFVNLAAKSAYGSPPQALVLTARRP
jgi:ubiquinone/menaquinone biosynthesis C-methylase UbiE